MVAPDNLEMNLESTGLSNPEAFPEPIIRWIKSYPYDRGVGPILRELLERSQLTQAQDQAGYSKSNLMLEE
jgi:hypothetical protein